MEYLVWVRRQLIELSSVPLAPKSRSNKTKRDTLLHALRQDVPPGYVMEFGVYRGSSINRIAAAFPDQTVYGFDSFEGFPQDGRKDWQQDFSVKGILPDVAENVELVPGYFEDSLPRFLSTAVQGVAFAHIDCDIYSSTRTVLEGIGPYLQTGSIIVFDELIHYPGFLANEMLALYEFACDTGTTFEWVSTRGGVLPLEEFLCGFSNLPTRMADFRALGLEQAAALRITSLGAG